MNRTHALLVAACVTALALTASAQPKPGAPASGPPAGGMGMGPGMGGGMHGRAGPDNTYGWSMMTPQEREEHQKTMSDMKSPGDCKAYTDKHHQEMMDRARQRGTAMPGQPPHNMCEGLN